MLLQHHLHAPDGTAVGERLVHVALRAAGEFLHRRVLTRPRHLERRGRTWLHGLAEDAVVRAGVAHALPLAVGDLLQGDVPLGQVARDARPLHVVERDVLAVVEEDARLGGQRAARLLDRELHVREAPVGHVVLRTELEDGRHLRDEAAVRERDVLHVRHALARRHGDDDRRAVARELDVVEAEVLHRERHGREVGHGNAVPARRVARVLRVEHLRHGEEDAAPRVRADDVGEEAVLHRRVAGPAGRCEPRPGSSGSSSWRWSRARTDAARASAPGASG